MPVSRPAGPLSVNLPEQARRRLKREALKRSLGLSTTLRVLAFERLDELEQERASSRAESWQRAEASATWDRIQAGDRREVSETQIRKLFDDARQKRK